jgi:SAM-dependent methyltransferase
MKVQALDLLPAKHRRDRSASALSRYGAAVSSLHRVRGRLRLRERFRSPAAIKGDAEITWWLRAWEPILREGGFSPPDVSELLDGEPPAGSYEGRRWQQARAEVRRVLREANIQDASFFDGKVVVDIGPGALGFPDACPARVSIGVEPLAQRFADAGLLLDSHAVYLAARAEAVPLVSSTVDVILARNSLDHVDDPRAAIAEARRLLRPGGTLILNFDVEHTPTATEPHALDADEVRSWLGAMAIEHEDVWDYAHGHDGHAVVLVARQP